MLTDPSHHILITGASGFIGSRLTQRLSTHPSAIVRCLVRKTATNLPAGVDQCIGDVLNFQDVRKALEGIDTAYYLVHSMGGTGNDFEEKDRIAAQNFIRAADDAGVKRIIYLGGLGKKGDHLSHHLASRLEVAEILKSGNAKTTFLRAAVIIGKGGASYEMLKSLVERLPVMITPRWVETRSQPIAVTDVISYLVGCLSSPETAGHDYDIGGPDILTYREMMLRFADVLGKRLFIVPVPFLTPHLSAYWVRLVTPVSYGIASALIDGLKNEVICEDASIRTLIPIPLTNYNDALRQALADHSI